MQNPFPWPVRLRATIQGQNLAVSVLGRGSLQRLNIPPLQVQHHWLDQQHLQVSVYRGNKRFSQDRYVMVQ